MKDLSFRLVRNIFFLGLLLFSLSVCSDDPTFDSRASFKIFPTQGDTLTLFLFDATSSVQQSQDNWRVKVRWDWENDGVWDTEFSIDKTATHRYENYGEKSVKLEVQDITGTKDTLLKTVQVCILIKDSVIIDSRDNQSYTVKKINKMWWMTQDLAFGSIISNKTSPTDNGIPERWIYPDSTISTRITQGFYTELEVTDYYRNIKQGICPEGWRIPTSRDCVDLNTFFWNQWNAFVLNDSLTYQFNPVYHGFYYTSTSTFYDTDQSNYYWIRQQNGEFSFSVFNESGFAPAYWNFDMESTWEKKLGKPFNRKWLGFALRCIKND